MPGSRATLQHLQVLQAARPLEVPQACLGAPVCPEPAPAELLANAEAEHGAVLREIVRKSQFWISLLEGEHSELTEEIARQKKRHQLSMRQVEAKASALREAEGEKKRLLEQNKWLQQSRDQAICERHLLREDASRATTRTKDDVESLAGRAGALEAELGRVREEKAELEAHLVRVKVRAAETLQKVDSMEYLIEIYEDQLRALNPAFEPLDLATVGHLMRPSRLDTDQESDASHEKESVTTAEKPKQGFSGFTKMIKGLTTSVVASCPSAGGGMAVFTTKKKHKDHDAKEHHPESQPSPRSAITPRPGPGAAPAPSPQRTGSGPPRSPRPSTSAAAAPAATPTAGLAVPASSPTGPAPRASPTEPAAAAASGQGAGLLSVPASALPASAGVTPAAAALRSAVGDSASPAASGGGSSAAGDPEKSPAAAVGATVATPVSPPRRARWEMRRED